MKMVKGSGSRSRFELQNKINAEKKLIREEKLVKIKHKKFNK